MPVKYLYYRREAIPIQIITMRLFAIRCVAWVDIFRTQASSGVRLMPLVLRSSPRFILATTRMIALVGYRKKERRWKRSSARRSKPRTKLAACLVNKI